MPDLLPAATAPPAVLDIAETLAALANGAGGMFTLPADSLRAPGMIDQILQAALLTDPPLVLPIPQLTPAGDTIVVSVPAGLPHVYGLNGRYLIRAGKINQSLPPDRLRRLLIERGELSYEEAITPGATLEDIDWTAAGAYAARVGASSTRELLVRRGCLALHEGNPTPTNAGILLFGRDPTRFVRGAHITAARFAGNEPSDQFTRLEITGTLPDQIRRAEAFLIDQMRRTVQLGATMERTEQFEYPLEAAREVVINAVAHRDYAIRGDGIRLFLFANRLEVTSPGQLAGPVTVVNIADERFSRNSIIVQVLADLGFIERLGYGIDRMLALMRSAQLPAPEFVETAGGFRVTLRHDTPASVPPATSASEISTLLLELNPRQQAALQFLDKHPRITNHDLQMLFPSVHSETIRRDLADLVTRGLLEKLGQKRGSYYVRAVRVKQR
ncbi:MAG: ATP-binding protein [Aggregatilineales bacterium]